MKKLLPKRIIQNVMKLNDFNHLVKYYVSNNMKCLLLRERTIIPYVIPEIGDIYLFKSSLLNFCFFFRVTGVGKGCKQE